MRVEFRVWGTRLKELGPSACHVLRVRRACTEEEKEVRFRPEIPNPEPFNP